MANCPEPISVAFSHLMQRYTQYICLIPITLGNGVAFLMDRKQTGIVANSVMTMVRAPHECLHSVTNGLIRI